MIEKFRWITWSVLPLVYDESLSYVELLNKVIAKLNEVIQATNDFTAPVQEIIDEWLGSAEGKAAIEGVIGDFIEQYAQTPDFQTVLKKALENQTDEIKQAATAATNVYLKTAEGAEVLEVEVVAFMTSYVKTPAFHELVKEFIAELNDILRGENLDIKQKKSASIYARNARMAAAELANDYSVNKTFYAIDVDDTGISIGDPNDVSAKVTKVANFSFKPLYMGFSTGDNKNPIKMVAEPTDNEDAATKGYVDAAVKRAVPGGVGSGNVVYVKLQELPSGGYEFDREISWIIEQLKNYSTVLLNCTVLAGRTEYPQLIPCIRYTDTSVWFGATNGVFGGQTDYENTKMQNAYAVWVQANVSKGVFVQSTYFARDEYMRVDGTASMSAALNMGNNQIKNVAAPKIDTDVTTKGYVDNAIANAPGGGGGGAVTKCDVLGTFNVATKDAQTFNLIHQGYSRFRFILNNVSVDGANLSFIIGGLKNDGVTTGTDQFDVLPDGTGVYEICLNAGVNAAGIKTSMPTWVLNVTNSFKAGIMEQGAVYEAKTLQIRNEEFIGGGSGTITVLAYPS